MKMTHFHRQNVDTLSREVMKDLEALAARHGLKLSPAGGKFTDASFLLKVRFETVADDGIPNDFRMKAGFYGLKPEDFGRLFNYKGETYRLSGTVKGRSRFAFLAKNVSTGKEFKFTAALVTAALKVV